MKRIVLVGGGTAGHVEPALAVAKAIRSISSNCQLEFIGTKSGIEVELLVDQEIIFSPILKVPFPRRLEFQTFWWPFKFFAATLQSMAAIKGSDLVIGFGGYVSAPAYLAAYFLRVPIIIHEANAKPGLANRFGARFARNLFISFPGAKATGGRWSKAFNSGLPIKSEIDNFDFQSVSQNKELFLKSIGLGNKRTLLVFGGSLGAQKINQVINKCAADIENLGWNLIQVVGGKNSTTQASANFVSLQYIQDMAGAYSAADYVICRAGAVTCAELMAVGLPALLIPLPIGNGEQIANAQELVDSGQAQVISNQDFDEEWLKANLGQLLQERSRSEGKPRRAAEIIAKRALDLLGNN